MQEQKQTPFNRSTYIKTPEMEVAAALGIRVGLEDFEKRPSALPDDKLKFLMDSLLAYFQSGFCGSFIYWKYRRALIAEYSRRLRAGG